MSAFIIFLLGMFFSLVQQPSYYALAYRLPWKYTQAVTAGESVSSVIESIVRTFTKLIVKSERIGGILYLCISVVISFLSAICHYYIRTHKMVIFYRKEPTQKQSSKEMVSGGESSDQQHLLSQPNGVELEPIRHSVDTKEKSHLPQEDDGKYEQDLIASISIMITSFNVSFQALGDFLKV